MPPSPASTPDPAEVARQEQELRELEAFAAGLQNRRIQSSASNADPDSSGGIIGWLIKGKLAHDAVQANLMLVGIAIAAVCLVVWMYWPRSTPGGLTPAQLNADLSEMKFVHP